MDISLGQKWCPYVPLAGANSAARGCQSDAACGADTISTREVSLPNSRRSIPSACGGYCDYFENCGGNCKPLAAAEVAGGAGGAGGEGNDGEAGSVKVR